MGGRVGHHPEASYNVPPDPHMTKLQRRKARRPNAPPLLSNGLWATFAGSLIWLLSMAMALKESMQFASRALLAPAAMGIFVGLGLLIMHVLSGRRAQSEARMLLRQHSTLMEPMPRLKPGRKDAGNSRPPHTGSSAVGR